MNERFSMLWYKLWLETRVRFYIAFALNISICLLYVVMQRHFYALYLKFYPDATYVQYVYWQIFSHYPRGMFQFTGFVLGLSGWQRERKQGTLGFSLSLPISRTRQVLHRALFEATQLATIAFASLLLVWATSNLMHHDLPLGTTLLFAVLWTTGGLLVFALTFLCSVICSSEYTAIAASYVLYLFYTVIAQQPRLSPYPLNDVALMTGKLGNVLDPHTMLWNGNIPMLILGGHLAVSAVLVAVAIFITSRQDV